MLVSHRHLEIAENKKITDDRFPIAVVEDYS